MPSPGGAGGSVQLCPPSLGVLPCPPGPGRGAGCGAVSDASISTGSLSWCCGCLGGNGGSPRGGGQEPAAAAAGKASLVNPTPSGAARDLGIKPFVESGWGAPAARARWSLGTPFSHGPWSRAGPRGAGGDGLKQRAPGGHGEVAAGAWCRPVPPPARRAAPCVPDPSLPSFTRLRLPLPPAVPPATPAQTHSHAEQEHLEALFQPFTIVRTTTSSQEMSLRRHSLTAPRRRARRRQKPPVRIHPKAGGALPGPPLPQSSCLRPYPIH